MTIWKYLLAGLVWLWLAAPVLSAQAFLSESSGPPVSLPPTAPHISLLPGHSGSLYLWVLPDAGKPIDGLGLSLATNTPGIASLTALTIFNPANTAGVNRWDSVGVGTSNAPGYLFRDSNAVSVLSRGLSTAAADMAGDPQADIAHQAYLDARIDILAGANLGNTQLSLQVGQALITLFDGTAASGLLLGASGSPVSGGTVGVSSGVPSAIVSVVPEPSEVTSAACALLIMVFWRGRLGRGSVTH